MDVRELRKEVNALPQLSANVQKFQTNWLRPIRSNTNQHAPYINDLSNETKKQINTKLQSIQEHLSNIKNADQINDKLSMYMRYLVELKLANMQDNHSKAQVLSNRLASDDVLKMSTTISQIKQAQVSVSLIKNHYEEINDLLSKELSLDQTVHFLELPHQRYLATLLKTTQNHSKIISQIGRHFVPIAKKAAKRKRKHK